MDFIYNKILIVTINISKTCPKLVRWSPCFCILKLFLLLSTFTYAQKEGNIWYFGEMAGLNFNTGIPIALTNGVLGTMEGCSAISDNAGELLFYTNGTTVWNKNHEQMPNGLGIMGHTSSTQSALIVSKPGSNNIYYIFTTPAQVNMNNTFGFRYSIVDMTLNGGLGDVTTKNVLLYDLSTEKLTAVRHSNGCEIWIISHEWNSDKFLAYLLKASGLDTVPVISNVGTVHNGGQTNNNAAGQMKVSSDGGKLALAFVETNNIELFKFDNASGLVSNPVTFPSTLNSGVGSAYGIEFSFDGTKLYVSTKRNLYQYDLMAGSSTDIINSCTLVGTTADIMFGGLQLGPDGKIYCAKFCGVGCPYLGAINNPNASGILCNYTDFAVYLNGKKSLLGLPTFLQSFFYPAFKFGNGKKCAGDSVLFTITDISNLDSVYWDFDDPSSGPLNTSTDINPYHIYNAPGAYNVQLIKYGSCESVFAKTVVIYDIPKIDLGNDTILCQGTTVLLNAQTPGSTYLWQDGSVNSSFTVLSAGTYWVEVINVCGYDTDSMNVSTYSLSVATDSVPVTCFGGTDGSASINVSGGFPAYTYLWNDPGAQQTAIVTGLSAGIYKVIATDDRGCAAEATVGVFQPAALIMSSEAIPVKCYGGNDGSAIIIASGGIAPYSYTWNPPVSSTATAFNLAPGNYTVVIKDDNDCEQTASFTMNEPDSLVAAVSGPASICEGKSAIIHAIATGGTLPYTYNWSPGAMNGSSITISPSVTTTYSVVVTDANGCTATPEGITITLNALPIISFTADPKSGCAPLCVSFNNTMHNTSIVYWNLGDGNSGAEAAMTHCYPDPGTYDVTLTVVDNNGCTNSLLAPDLIKVFPNPIANFTMTPPYAAPIYSTVFFHDQSLGALNWLWNFGDIANTSSIVKNPAFSYKETGPYTVNLIVKSDEGCKDTISHTIIIEPEFSLYIPNAFTPDNDGVNDFFSPKGVEFSSFEMEIYNRWGEEIYHTSDIDQLWNGRIKGETEVAKQDVYVYKIWVKDFKDETHYYVGNVSLIKY